MFFLLCRVSHAGTESGLVVGPGRNMAPVKVVILGGQNTGKTGRSQTAGRGRLNYSVSVLWLCNRSSHMVITWAEREHNHRFWIKCFCLNMESCACPALLLLRSTEVFSATVTWPSLLSSAALTLHNVLENSLEWQSVSVKLKEWLNWPLTEWLKVSMNGNSLSDSWNILTG